MNLFEKLRRALLNRPTLSFHERMVQAYIKGKKMPLKGHTRIIFTDINTGKETVVADTDNLVTNAVAGVLAKNWCGLADMSSLLPLKNMYSGVLCFQNTMTENADNYNPPNNTVNPLTAHAGQTMNNTGSLLRGNPVVSDIVETDTSVKWVWSWDSTHGNGTISTVCLCPDILGNMGLKPFNTDYNPLSQFGVLNETAVWSEARSKHFPFSIADDGKTAKTLWVDGTTFKEYTIRHDYFAHGIMRSASDWQEVSVRTATISINGDGFTNNKSFIFADDDYYYICTADSSAIYASKVAKSDFSVTATTFTFTGVSLWTGTYEGYADCTVNKSMPMWGFDGTSLYYPNSAGNQFYRLNMTNLADVELINGQITISKRAPATASTNYRVFTSPIAINTGLILGDNYIINGNTAYQIRQAENLGTGSITSNRAMTTIIRKGTACYGDTTCMSDYGNVSGQSVIFNGMFLSTINVLEEPVVKTNTMAMRIEYTLTEA